MLHAAGMNPNWEYNERNTAVVFGALGERKKNSEAGARFPVKLEIVAAETPLILVGTRRQRRRADVDDYDLGIRRCPRSGWREAQSGRRRRRRRRVASGAMDRFGYLPMMSSRFTVTQTFDRGS